MTQSQYRQTLVVFYLTKLYLFLSSMFLFYHFVKSDEYFALFLAIFMLYGAFLFYGFEIRFKKLVAEDNQQAIYDLMYKDISRRERRIVLRKLGKKKI